MEGSLLYIYMYGYGLWNTLPETNIDIAPENGWLED